MRKAKKKANVRPDNTIFVSEYDAVQAQLIAAMINPSGVETFKMAVNQWIERKLDDDELDEIFKSRNPLIAFNNSLSARDVKLIDKGGNTQNFVAGDPNSAIGVPMEIELAAFKEFATLFAAYTAPQNTDFSLSDKLSDLASQWIGGTFGHKKFFLEMRGTNQPADSLLDYLSHFDLTFVDRNESFSINVNRKKFVDILTAAQIELEKSRDDIKPAIFTEISFDQFNALHLHAEKVSNGQTDALPSLLRDLKKFLNIECDENEMVEVLATSEPSYHHFNRFLSRFDFTILKGNDRLQIVCTDETTYLEEERIVQAMKADFLATDKEVEPPQADDVKSNDENFSADDLISTADAAKILNVSTSTLKNWRTRELFGVPFFTADVMKNGAWYYYRERVEQLAAVYQPGILQNMYKLARKFKGEKVCLFDFCDSKGGHFQLEKITPKFFPQDEVAKILGVNEKTIDRWRENGKFKEDMTDHEGVFWYSAERVEEMKSIKTKAAQIDSQHIANLPDELLNQPRFFRVGRDVTKKGKKIFDQKAPVDKWSKPDNQKRYDELQYTDKRQMAGFDIVGHGKAADYLILDFDHVLDDAGNFSSSDAEKWYNLILSFADTFVEKSVSGHGLHILYRPAEGEFPTIINTAESSGVLEFGDGAKIEIFYKPEGRYFLLTGDVYDCAPQTPIATDCAAVKALIQEIKGRNAKKDFSDDTAPNDDARNARDIANARDMLSYINCVTCTYTEWLHVGMILKTTGTPIEDWLKWSATDAERYDEKVCRDKWKSFKDNGALTIATLYLMASKNGYKTPKFRAEYNDRAVADNSLYSQLNKVKKQISDFETEKNAAIELLKNLETFDSESVFAEEITNAAAFAKIFNRKIYSDFIRAVKLYGDKHPTEKAAINDLKNIVKDAAAAIVEREKSLRQEYARINGAIHNKKFLADNLDLQNFRLPTGYSLSLDEGIKKIVDDKGTVATISHCPVIIAGKTKSVDEKKFKLILQLWTRDNKRRILPPYPASTVFNSRRIIDLADDGLAVSSKDAFWLTDYLNAFNVENENLIPQTCTVPRCGWYFLNGKDIFVDPRRSCTFTDEGKEYPLIADSNSQFAKALTSRGTLDKWRDAYTLAKQYPVARFIVAASVAAPLLNLLGERNFLIFIYTKTRAGKTTSLCLGASAIGSEKIIRTFDATKNGLIGAAADVNDFAFLIDEKQVADNYIAQQFNTLVMALSGGVGRTKLNKDSSLKKTSDWRTIAIMTGETPLLDDSANGGAFTRLIQINAPTQILPPDVSKLIRAIIKENYGLAFPRVIDKIFDLGKEKLNESYSRLQDIFSKQYTDILPEYRRYISVVTLADSILNSVLGVDEPTAKKDALNMAHAIFNLTPTLDDIDDTQRAIDAVIGFITENQSRFIGGNIDFDKMQKFYGKILGDLIYITVDAMKAACDAHGLNYHKTVADLIDAGIIGVPNKIDAGCKKPRKTVQVKLAGVNSKCYQIILPNSSEKIL